MTNQEAFDKAAAHLLQQGRRAVAPIRNADGSFVSGGGTACRYRAPNGDACAIGCLIPDDEYLPSMEGCSAARLILGRVEDRVFVPPPSLAGLDPSLLASLQSVHDDASPEGWFALLHDVASVFDLSTAVLDEVES